jgi:hypothetical protein
VLAIVCVGDVEVPIGHGGGVFPMEGEVLGGLKYLHQPALYFQTSMFEISAHSVHCVSNECGALRKMNRQPVYQVATQSLADDSMSGSHDVHACSGTLL